MRIEIDTGLVGWGEAHAPYAPTVTQALILDLLAPLVLGENPLAGEVLWERMYGAMRLRGHNTGFTMEAIAGIDIALWDLRGKILDQPIYALLGGPYRSEIPAYASGVPGVTDAQRQAVALSYLDAGYTAVKLAIGRRSLEEDLATVAAVVEVTGERAHLLVDAHGAYDLGTAIQVGREFERLGVHWFEDPLLPEDHAGYAELSRALDILVVAGETECNRFQFRDRLAARAVQRDPARHLPRRRYHRRFEDRHFGRCLPHAVGRARQHGYHGSRGGRAAFGRSRAQFPRLRIPSAADSPRQRSDDEPAGA